MDVETKDAPTSKLPARTFVLLAGIFILCLVVFTMLAYNVVYRHNDSFDLRVSTYFYQYRAGTLVSIMRMITFFGSSFFLLPAYVLLIGFLAFRKKLRSALAVAAISFLSWLALSELKMLFQRRRPHLPLVTDITTYSFPSGHTFSSLIFFSLLAYTLAKWLRRSSLKKPAIILVLFCPVAIGFSRIVLNVHYTTDVIAGFCLGVVWLVLSYALCRKFGLSSN